MKQNHFLISLIFFLLSVNMLTAQPNTQATVFGEVTNSEGSPVSAVNVSIKGLPVGTVTDKNGEYLLRVPANRHITLTFSFIGYNTIEKELQPTTNERIGLNITLHESLEQLDEVEIASHRQSQNNMISLDPNISNTIPNAATGGIETLIKTLPGVSSNNEMSSQYSVRGGNFDENLVYVNGIEIYRPFLVKSGQQEGLSFVNSDLVSSIDFSAGGFEAKYGDKMASVLDITYRKPTEFKGSFSLSLLEGSLHLEDISKNGKLSYIGGIRYKTNRYLLNSLDETGEYNPNFTDIQAYISYQLSNKVELSFLGNLARNQYDFIPQDRETSFGTYTNVYNAKIYFDGQEKDLFNTTFGALSANYSPNEHLDLTLTTTAFQTQEEINYDIHGYYYISQFGIDESASDSTLNLGRDAFLDHARNNLDAQVYSVTHSGSFKKDRHQLNWSAKVQYEKN